MTSALARLVDDPEVFRRKWPDTPRVFKSPSPRDIHSLLSRDDARRIVSEPGCQPFQMAMVREGVLTGSRPSADHVTDTLGLNGLHLTWPPLISFCRALAGELGHQVTGNAYLTPPNAKGYPPHWDTHHVWLAQVEGAKLWRLNRPVFTDPLERHAWTKVGFTPEQREAVTAGAPDFEITLHAGEVLWIPRGWVHHGRTGEEHSLHVTLGVQLLTRHWVLERLVDKLTEEVELRAALPPGLSDADFAQLVLDTAALAVDTINGWEEAPVGQDLWLAQQMAMLGRK
ncbi:hypothetical protein GCM10027168_01940 [Streptomyces capparidis]